MSWTSIKKHHVDFQVPPAFDKRTHMLCTLPNGLITLLVSDPNDKSTSCSLSVAAGSHMDPESVLGLAHLCEHMILSAGSKAHPEPNLYHSLIAKYNGSQNAYTTGEQTTFYFELPNSHQSAKPIFEEVLEVFASFFKNPLFNGLLTNKEIYAIESEHEGNTASINKIFYHAARILANEKHPFSRFSTGNILSLKGMTHLQKIDLKSLLSNYFDEKYISTNMAICIKGSQSVNALAKLAFTFFGDIKSYPSQRKKVLANIRPFNPNSATQYFEIPKNIENYRILDKVWKENYKSTLCFSEGTSFSNLLLIQSKKIPTIRYLFPINLRTTRFSKRSILTYSNLWCELFGDESENSLCHLLKKESWATSCYAFVSNFAVGCYGLVFELQLTTTGWKNVDTISKLIFACAVPMYINEDPRILGSFLEEHNKIELIKFIYKGNEESSMDECAGYSEYLLEDLSISKPELLLKAIPSMVELRSKALGSIVNESDWWFGQAVNFQNFLREFVNPDRVRLIAFGDIRQNDFFESQKASFQDASTDLFYKFEYWRSRADFTKFSNTINEYKVRLPEPNIFLPSKLKSLHYLEQLIDDSSLKSEFALLSPTIINPDIRAKPTLLKSGTYHDIWLLQEEIGNMPLNTSIVTFDITSQSVKPSPHSTMCLEILGQVLNELVLPAIYPSLKLGYAYEVATSPRGQCGLRFTIGGFCDGILEMIKIFTEVIKMMADIASSIPDKQLFRKARVLVRNLYESARQENCVQLASIGLLILLEECMWPLDDRFSALEEIDLQGFKNFCNEFIEGTKSLKLFIQGNIENHCEISNYLVDNFIAEKEALNIMETAGLSSISLIPGTNMHASFTGHADDMNNAIVYFIQTGAKKDKRNYNLTLLAEYILSLTLTTELRNKRQVGYVTVGGLRELTSTIGIHVTIMSSGDPLDVEQQIEDYLVELGQELGQISNDSEFRGRYVEPYVALVQSSRWENIRSASGPTNLLHEVIANIAGGDFDVLFRDAMRRHKKHYLELFYRESDTELDCSDLAELQHLDLQEFITFWTKVISPHSNTRSKISIAIRSPVSREMARNKQLFLQLQAFLKHGGFAIQSDRLAQLVEDAGSNPTAILKGLCHEFRGRSEAWRFIRAVVLEIFRAAGMSLATTLKSPIRPGKRNYDEQHDNSLTDDHPLVLIEDPNYFRTEYRGGIES